MLIKLLNIYKIALLLNNIQKLALIEKFKGIFKLVAKEITYNKINRLVTIKALITTKVK